MVSNNESEVVLPDTEVEIDDEQNSEEGLPEDFFSLIKLTQFFDGYVFICEIKKAKIKTFLTFRIEGSEACLVQVYDISELSEEKRESYIRDFTKIEKINHPNIDRIYDFKVHKDFLFIATKKRASCSLERYIEEGRIAFENYLEVSIQLAGALEELHNRKLYHGGLMSTEVSINETYFVSLKPPLLYQLKVDLKLISVDHKNGVSYLGDGHNTGQKSYFSIDTSALGSLICFVATGYTPNEIKGLDWEGFGLHPELHDMVNKAANLNDGKFFTQVSELANYLEEIQDRKVSLHDVGKPCLQAKFLRKKNNNCILIKGRSITASGTGASKYDLSEEDFENYDYAYKPAKDLLFNNTYELVKCISMDELGVSLSAFDHIRNKESIWLHLFEHPKENEWSNNFKSLAKKLLRFKHENIAEVVDWKLLEDVGFIVNMEENGTILTKYIKEKKLTYPQIIDFALQITRAFFACEQNDIQSYKLSCDDIIVSEKEDGSLHYKILSVGHSSILHLTHKDREQIDWLTSSETRPPEAYEGILRGFRTTQYILSQIIYRAVMGYHPCQSMEVDEALEFHKSIKKINFGDYQDDIPNEFQMLYRRISSPLVERRYSSAENLLKDLIVVAECKPSTRRSLKSIE